MSPPTQLVPAGGSRLVEAGGITLLFGQPPEVLKGLLQQDATAFDTLVLADVREQDGSLLNNLEFPLYYFLFVRGGLADGKRLNLVGEREQIEQTLRLLHLTLLGPDPADFDAWDTPAELQSEWLAVSRELALKDATGAVIPVRDLFNILPYENGAVTVDTVTIDHLGTNRWHVTNGTGSLEVDLPISEAIEPTYWVQRDYVPGGLVKLGIEILGGASGFTPNEPCTGLALCYNGDYVLIDSIPFLDHHLFARGISKNQVSALFLTHLHDDHCTMFPLMLMPHRVEVITTREIFDMAMEKLGCSLGWTRDAVAEHFTLIEVKPGEVTNYYGLSITPHVTVHSIPTIGATFTSIDHGYERQICVVGDNHSMGAIRHMNDAGAVRNSTLAALEGCYTERYSLLVADGGAGAIHGDPADALTSNADRVLFVHVEELPNEFDTTFSLASSGKRYTVIDNDPSLYASQVNHYLTAWLGEPFPNRWMRSLMAEEEIRRYNSDDVIIVQDSDTRGLVYLILTGYCDVVQHSDDGLAVVAKLQAGDIIGEMAIVTGAGIRNASIVAKTPVTVCVFSEQTFNAFILSQGFRDKLLNRWSLRPLIRQLPQFADISSTVLEKISDIADPLPVAAGELVELDCEYWTLFHRGEATTGHPPNAGGNDRLRIGDEFGWLPFEDSHETTLLAVTDALLVQFPRTSVEDLRLEVPELNYLLRKMRDRPRQPWRMAPIVPT